MHRIMCEWCGAIIIGKRKRFCNKLCQNRYLANNQKSLRLQRQQIRETTAGVRYCKNCGKVLTEYQISYCSRRCSNKGRGMSDETRQKLREAFGGENHPMYGKHHTQESKDKIRNKKLGKHLSEDCKRKMRESHRSEEPTKIVQDYQIIADKYYEYKCCGCGKSTGKLNVHHIDNNHENNDPDNLVWLCNRCHCAIHMNRHRGSEGIDEEMTKLVLENRKLNYKGVVE